MKREVDGLLKTSHRISGVKRGRKIVRNSRRRLRRKRSKLRYYTNLKESRYKRKTQDLCSAVTVIDITDMEWNSLGDTSTEVAEWHKQEQVAYWKSRALSLEYENRMLLQHLRNVYAKQTEDYANYISARGEIEEDEEPAIVGEKKKRLEINQPFEKNRSEEMDKLYGKEAKKIMGMETAVQLNYDLHSEKDGRIPHWPHTPLNLKFD